MSKARAIISSLLDSLGGDLASFEISSKSNNINMVNFANIHFQKFSNAFLRAKTTCHNDDFNLKVVALDPIYHVVVSHLSHNAQCSC
jgi:hypothetical protein